MLNIHTPFESTLPSLLSIFYIAYRPITYCYCNILFLTSTIYYYSIACQQLTVHVICLLSTSTMTTYCLSTSFNHFLPINCLLSTSTFYC